MKKILKKSNNIIVTNNNITYTIKNCKDLFIEILEGSYTTPSYITANHKDIIKAKEKGLWLEFFFECCQSYKDLEFDSLLVNIKPKYNFINFIRCKDGEYSGKCINFNLAINTSYIFNEIMKEIEDNNAK